MSSESNPLPFWSPRIVRGRSMQVTYVMLVLGAACIRAVLRITQNELAAPDLWEFDDIAVNLIETGVFSFRVPGVPTAYMPPAFPLMIAGFYQVFGIGLTAHAALAVMLWCFDLALCFLVGWLGQRLWGARVGWLAFLLALWWPNFVMMSGRLHDIPIYMTLLLGAFCVLLLEHRPALQRAALTGAIMGIFGLFRFEAIGLLVPFAYYLAFHTRETRLPLGQGWVRRILVVATMVAVFALPLLPWLVRTHVEFGRPLLSSVGGYALLRGHHEHATGSGRDPWPSAKGTPVPHGPEIDGLTFEDPQDELVRDAWYRNYAITYIKTHPKEELELAAMKIFYFTVADFTHPYARLLPVWGPSLIALLVGLVYWIRVGLRVPEQQVFWMLFGLQLCLVVVLFVLPRYRQLVDFVPLLFFSAWLCAGAFGGRLSSWLWAEPGASAGQLGRTSS